jgi:hypothetical protein
MKTLKESLLADIESNIKNGDNIELCDRLFGKKQKEMNDAIIDLMNKIKRVKTNKVDPHPYSLNKLKRSAQASNNYIVKIFVDNDKYNVSICKFMYAGIWNILNIFSCNTTITMYARANWEDVIQQLLVIPDKTTIYEIESDELNDLFDAIHNNAKEYIMD